MLTPMGWKRTSDDTVAVHREEKELLPEELAKVTGEAQITNYGWLEFQVYNGSTWTLNEVTVQVEVFDVHKAQKISRLYRLIPEPYASRGPQTNAKFHAALGFTLDKGETWSFSVSSAKGIPE
jgi:hypothetical protein